MIRRETGFVAVLVAAGMSVALAGASFAGQDQTTNQNGNMSGNTNAGNMSGMTGNMGKGRKKSNMNGNMSGDMSGNMNGGMAGKMAMGGVTEQDRKFMMQAAMSDMNEIQSAQAALQKSSSDSVKQYAQKMIDDHTRMSEEGKALAAQKGITLPTDVDPKMKMMMTKMQAMSGADFDKNYIKTAGDKDHRKTEKDFQREISKGSDADIKAAAQKNLPTVQMHLQMAQSMESSMMGMKSMKTGGNINSNMSGNMNGGMSGNMNGNMSGSMNDNMSGNMNDNMSKGKRRKGSNMNGNMNGNMGGNMNGNMNGNSNMGGGNMNSNNGNLSR